MNAQSPPPTTEKSKSILAVLEDNLVPAIWEVIIGIVAILATVLQEYLGELWVLVLVLALVVFAGGLLLRRSRWFSLFTFIAGCVLTGCIVWAAADASYRPVPLPTYTPRPTYTPLATHTPPTQDTSEANLPGVLIASGQADLFDGIATVTCKWTNTSDNHARVRLSPIGGNWQEFTMYVGDSKTFQVGTKDYYLTLLAVDQYGMGVQVGPVPK